MSHACNGKLSYDDADACIGELISDKPDGCKGKLSFDDADACTGELSAHELTLAKER